MQSYIVSMEDENQLVVLEGINDCIVAQSEGVLLVCHRAEEQRIKEFTSDASERYDKKFD